MNNSISIGLLGIGGYARQHLSYLGTLHQAGICRFVAAADPFAASHPQVVAGLQSQGVHVYDDALPLLERDDIDAVIIATPIHYHAPQTIHALNCGKHVYLEKPPCATLEEWHQMVNAQERASQKNLVCAVGFQQQTLPGLRYLKAQLLSGTLGELQVVSSAVRWQRCDSYYNRSPWAGCLSVDGQPVFDGPATNALAHVVHAALYLAGTSENEWAQLKRVRGTLKHARPIESYDSVYLEAETTSGAYVRLAFTHATPSDDAVAIHCMGSKASATIFWSGELILQPHQGEAKRFTFVHNTHAAALLDFLGAVRGENRPFTALRDTLSYLQLVNGARQSCGGSIAFPAQFVKRIGGDAPQAWYEVAGLDTEMESFAVAPFEPPSLLRPVGEWVEPAQILETL